MVTRWVLVISLGLIATLAEATAQASTRTTLSRADIRSLPITVRPNRPGHFYGNAVRRNSHRRGS
jgi:hypothetical protein